MDNSEEVQRAIEERRCLFGTVDSWLLYVILSDSAQSVLAAMLVRFVVDLEFAFQ